MIMDPKDINSDLIALTRLYGLLKQDGDGTYNSNSTTDLLDEHARILLKNLLDAETKRVLKEYSEVQQLDESPKKQLTPLSKLSLTAEAYQSHENIMGFISPQWNQACRPEQLMQSVVTSGLEHTKKRCRLCQKNTIAQLKPIEETHFYDDSEDSKKITNKSEDADRLSKEASEAIEHIELCLSALRIRADHSNMFDKGQSEESFTSRGDHPFEISSQSTMARPVGYSYPLHQVRCLAAEEMNQPFWLLDQASSLASRGPFLESDASIVECKFPTKNANTIIQPGNWIMGHYDFVPSQNHNVRNLGQLEPIETPYTKMEVPYQAYKPPGNVSSILGPHGKNHKKPSQDEICKNRKYISESTTSDSYSNRMPSQRTSSRSSDSEEYSTTDQTGEYLTSSTWSSESRSESEYNSYTSNNIEDNDDAYSSTSSVADLKSIASARSTYSSASKKLVLSRARKANGKKMGEKQTGMWKKMKDKMSIIFHHHHHHHHHHHDDDGRGKSKTKTKTGGLEENINFSRQDGEECGEKAVEKVKKSMMVRNKNQQNNFHGLVEGLLRHARHSKSKPSKKGKETIGKLGKDHHERQKSFKKSHWWKMMQHHRRNKLTNKTYAKLGLGKKKGHLKALPHMK